MPWKPEIGRSRQPDGGKPPTTRVKICADLLARGVDAEAAESLAGRIAAALEGKDPAAYEATLDGVALSCRARPSPLAPASGAGELQEVERLMGAFATELGKLDEVLEVLAAHLRRMRVAAGGSEPRTLH